MSEGRRIVLGNVSCNPRQLFHLKWVVIGRRHMLPVCCTR